MSLPLGKKFTLITSLLMRRGAPLSHSSLFLPRMVWDFTQYHGSPTPSYKARNSFYQSRLRKVKNVEWSPKKLKKPRNKKIPTILITFLSLVCWSFLYWITIFTFSVLSCLQLELEQWITVFFFYEPVVCLLYSLLVEISWR